MDFEQSDDRGKSAILQGEHWAGFANDFVLQMTNRRIKGFVKIINKAKIETERKMRLELDAKIYFPQGPQGEMRLKLALGK